MELVLIGGPPRAGKTTVARRLARRHGFRLYSADTRTWRHRDRALAVGDAAARRWESRSPAERWRQPVEELLATSLHRERGAMVLDDLRTLPEQPLTIAEGSVVPAGAVAAGIVDASRAVWLLPTPEFQQAQLAAHEIAPGPAALYRRLRELAERDAREHDIRDFYARPWAQGDADEVRRLFVCECGDRRCDQEIETTVGRAADGPVLAARE